MLPSVFRYRFVLFLLVAFACHATHAQTAADTCKTTSCLDLRALSVSCGYNIDLDQSRQKTYDETVCICGDSSYTRISTSCFQCIDALNIAGYNATQWGDDCYQAYLQSTPGQKSAAAAGNGRRRGIDLVIYGVLVITTASMGAGLL